MIIGSNSGHLIKALQYRFTTLGSHTLGIVLVSTMMVLTIAETLFDGWWLYLWSIIEFF